jgi:hypothetical protein
LLRADRELNKHGYRPHEFGDSVLVETSKHSRIDAPTIFDPVVGRGVVMEAAIISK